MAATRVSLSMNDSVLERVRHHSLIHKVSISKLFVVICAISEVLICLNYLKLKPLRGR